MSYLYSRSVAAGGETSHAATFKAVPVMHTGNSCGRAVGREWTVHNKQSVNFL